MLFHLNCEENATISDVATILLLKADWHCRDMAMWWMKAMHNSFLSFYMPVQFGVIDSFKRERVLFRGVWWWGHHRILIGGGDKTGAKSFLLWFVNQIRLYA